MGYGILEVLVSATVVSILTARLLRWATNAQDEDQGEDSEQ